MKQHEADRLMKRVKAWLDRNATDENAFDAADRRIAALQQRRANAENSLQRDTQVHDEDNG